MDADKLFKPPENGVTKITRNHNGYAYKVDSRKGTRCYLECIKKSDATLKCKGRCILVKGKITETGKHNHPPNNLLEDKRKLNEALCNAAKKNLGSFKECYEKYAKLYPTAAANISYATLSRKFRMWSIDETCKTEKSYQTNRVQNIITKTSPVPEINNLEHLVLKLNNNQHLLDYKVVISKQRYIYHITSNLVNDGLNKHLVIYDKELMESICDARKIIIHKMTSIIPQKCGTHVIIITFEKYEKALAGCWLLMGGEEEFSYAVLFKYIKLLFPRFNPTQAVVDYNQNIQLGLNTTFPNLEFIPFFLHQIQDIFENAIKTNAAIKMNRIKNAVKHAVLRKFMALSLLPKDHILSSYNVLINECKTQHGTYFDSFIDYYTKTWIEVWKPEVFSVYRFKHFTKYFLECYEYRNYFSTGKELDAFSFLEKVKSISAKSRIDLHLLERGNVLNYNLTAEDEEREKNLYKTWDRLDDDLITVNECLVICSNLLSEDFIETLPDSAIDKDKANDDSINSNIQYEIIDIVDAEMIEA